MSNKWELLKEEEESMELDLAPMLAMMVSLIPILLLSTVFVRLAMIDSPLPQVVAKAIEKQKKEQIIIDPPSSSKRPYEGATLFHPHPVLLTGNTIYRTGCGFLEVLKGKTGESRGIIAETYGNSRI